MKELLKEYVFCVLESNVEKLRRQKGVKLMRVGGLSPVRQTNKDAPEKRGVWAFVWPYFDLYFLSATNDRGIAHQGSDGKMPVTRLDQFNREGFRTFFHSGVMYTRFKVPNSTETGDWFKTTGVDLANYLSKHHSQLMKDYRALVDPSGRAYDVRHSNPAKFFASGMWSGMWEVFVPNPEKG